MKFLLLPAVSILAMSLSVHAVAERMSPASGAHPSARKAGAQSPLSRAIQSYAKTRESACALAEIAPTDTNNEASTGRPWYE